MSDTIRGSLEENILTLLIWNDEHAPMLAEMLHPEIFSDRMHETLARAAIAHIKERGVAPGVHIRDRLYKDLQRDGGISRMLGRIIDASEKLANDIQPEYVLGELDEFIKRRRTIMVVDELYAELQAGRRDKVASLLLTAALTYMEPTGEKLPDPWSEPEPAPFDPDVLPPVLRNFVKERARTTGFDPAGLAWAALSICSAAMDGSVRLQMKRHDLSWRVPPGIWVLLFGDPSTGRTPIMEQAWQPLVAIQNERSAEHKKAMARWKAEDKDSRGDEPQIVRLFTKDATIESLQDIMELQDRGIAEFRDEWSGFIGQIDAYSQGKGSGLLNRAFRLQSFDGGSYEVDRTRGGRGFVHVKNNHVVMCGGVQPERMRELGNLHSDGLLQRNAVIVLRQKRGGEDRPSSGRAVNDYEFLIHRLVLQPGNRTVTLSDEALKVREDMEERLASWTENDTLGMGFKTFCGKLLGFWGRFTLVLGHVIQSTPGNEPPHEIGFEAADAARSLIMDHLLVHAVRFYMWLGGGNKAAELTQQIAGFVLTKEIHRLTPSMLTSSVHGCRGMKLEQIQQALSPLVAMGWLTPEREVRANAWQVNPEVHRQFHERAAVERIRRAQVQELIQQNAVERRQVAVPESEYENIAENGGRLIPRRPEKRSNEALGVSRNHQKRGVEQPSSTYKQDSHILVSEQPTEISDTRIAPSKPGRWRRPLPPVKE